jgi:hypothetical protein
LTLCILWTFSRWYILKRNTVGGVLLITCFQNGKKEIEIGVVSIENENNWSWFLHLILENLIILPAFIIFDQGKGLLLALAKVSPEITHFVFDM